MATPAPAPLPQDEDYAEKLKHEIFVLVACDIDNRYDQGEKLELLQRERAKPGSGTFVADVIDIGMAVPTAYRRIKFFHDLAGDHRDPSPVRLSRIDKDGKRKPVKDVLTNDQLIEQHPPEDDDDKKAAAAADLKHKRIEEYIDQERERVAAEREKKKRIKGGGLTHHRHAFLFTDAEWKEFKECAKQLGERKASRMCLANLKENCREALNAKKTA
jgi:hypothetical protein